MRVCIIHNSNEIDLCFDDQCKDNRKARSKPYEHENIYNVLSGCTLRRVPPPRQVTNTDQPSHVSFNKHYGFPLQVSLI